MSKRGSHLNRSTQHRPHLLTFLFRQPRSATGNIPNAHLSDLMVEAGRVGFLLK